MYTELFYIFAFLIVLGIGATVINIVQLRIFRLRMKNPKMLKIFDFTTVELVALLLILSQFTELRYSIVTNCIAIVAIITSILTLVLIMKHRIDSILYIVFYVMGIMGLMYYFFCEYMFYF